MVNKINKSILIVFLLKSFDSSAVNVTPHKGLRLPSSITTTNPVEGVKLIVSQKAIFVDQKQVAELVEGKLKSEDVEESDQDFIQPLYKELDRLAKQSQKIAEINEEFKFEGVVVMQADAKLPYDLLKKVMYTSSLAGYADMKMATIAVE